MFSSVGTTEITPADPGPNPNRSREISDLAGRSLSAQRAKTVPIVGVVSNFDPDIREFLTAPLRGYVPVQVNPGNSGVYGTLAVQSDYTKPVTVADVVAQGLSATERDRQNKRRLLPRPGYPALIFPASGNGPSMNTSYIRGGKQSDLKRSYPSKLITKAFTTYNLGDTSNPGLQITYDTPETLVLDPNATHLTGVITLDGWDQNSPLPPGARYWEYQDLLAKLESAPGAGGLPIAAGQPAPTGYDVQATISAITHVPLAQLPILLPHDSFGNLRSNLIPLPSESWWHLSEIYANRKYFKGEVVDPISWVDIDVYWQFRGITKTNLQSYLNSFPAAKYP